MFKRNGERKMSDGKFQIICGNDYSSLWDTGMQRLTPEIGRAHV